MSDALQIFGLGETKKFAKEVADHAGVGLANHDEFLFADDEIYIKSNDNVRNSDVFVVQSLYSDKKECIDRKLFKLAVFIGSLKDASAKRVTAVIPYLGYSRQDRKTKTREAITTKYIAQMLEAVGADRILTMDVHNLAAEQNAFRIHFDNLEAKNLFADHVARKIKKNKVKNLVVLSPDVGGLQRSDKFRNALNTRLGEGVDLVILNKIRVDGKVTAHKIIGDVKNKKAIVVDDIFATGGTILKAHEVLKAEGGELWAACMTHGIFAGNASKVVSKLPKVIVTDTIDPKVKIRSKKIECVSTAKIFGRAIRNIHEGGSISELLTSK